MRKAILAAVLALALAAAIPGVAQAVTLHKTVLLPHGVTRADPDREVVVETVAPPDSDDDGCADADDAYDGPGCEAPPPPPAPAPYPASEPAAVVQTTAPTGGAPLSSIAACESGGNYSAVDPSGTYWGAYQFDASTWASVSDAPYGSASPAEQDAAAAELYARSGSSPWPVCGQ